MLANSSRAEIASKSTSDEWRAEFVATIRRSVVKGQYGQALKLARRALKKYPDEFVCRYQYARLLGDWADDLPLKKQKPYKKQATKILKSLVSRLKNRSNDEVFGTCLNYYYQSQNYKGMLRFGKKFESRDRRKGLYAQGLASCMLAAEQKDKNAARMHQLAKRSELAWRKYKLKNENYYFAHYVFAHALALQGQTKLAQQSLQRAADLSSRKIKTPEFSEVYNLIHCKKPR